MASSEISSVIENAKTIGDTKIVIKEFKGVEADVLRSMTDNISDSLSDFVSVLASINGEKITIACGCGKDSIKKGLKAGDIVKYVANLTGGNGGGKPDFAMAGGKDKSKLSEALNLVEDKVKEIFDK